MYKITPLKSGRDHIEYKKPCMKDRILPRLGSLVVCGKSGSGKTVMIANLLKHKHMIHKFYDIIYLICLSPSKLLLEHVKHIKKENVIRTDDPAILNSIVKAQEEIIDSSDDGYEKAQKILVICDDVISSNKFMKSDALKSLFFQGQNLKMSVWLLTQSYVKLPRSLRINAHYMAFFSGMTDTETERLQEEHRPPTVDKKTFKEVISDCLKDPYSFIYLDNSHPDRNLKFRCGFDKIIKFNK
jgi:hypothetical protein